MKKILVFCFFPAFTPPSNGGQSRLFNFYNSLSRWHRVTLLSSTHIGVEEEKINHGVNFIERRIPKDQHFVTQWSGLEQYASGGDISAPTIAAASRFSTLLHQAYLDEYVDADVIIHDSPFTEGYDLFKGIDGKPRIYNAYNCESLLYQSLHPGERSTFIHDLVRQSERSMLESADLVLYCNENDLAAFQKLAPEADFAAHYAPNGMLPQPIEESTQSRNARLVVIFMGSGHPPNMAAARFIVERLAPQLPDVCFKIIGSCLPDGQYPANVMRLGMVSDEQKSRLLRAADLALNPMADGSGSNVKVLDYFSYSVPVLSTSFGMRGIHAEAGRDFIEASLEKFAATIKICLPDQERLLSIGRAGQRLAAENYTWDAIAKGAAEKIAELSNAREKLAKYVLVLNDYDSFVGIGGGGTRTRGLYAAVADWSPVVFVCFSNDGELRARKHGENVMVVTVPKSPQHVEDMNRVNTLFHVSCDDIVASRHCAENRWLHAVYSALRGNARAIIIEHCYMVPLPLAYGDRFVYSSQNIETDLKARLLEWHPLRGELVEQVERIESQSVECSAAIIAVSDSDAEGLLRGKRTAGPAIVVRNGADTPPPAELLAPQFEKVRGSIGQRAVVFLGSAHMPNIESARIIVESVAPACPDIEFHLIGSVCDALHMSIPKNIRLWGILDDSSKCAVMQSCGIAINPMVSGGGSNIKLADYIGNGLFVVTTQFGQRGYPASIQDHIAVAEIADFPATIKSTVNQLEATSAKNRLARQSIFLSQLSMKSLGGQFVNLLQDMEMPKKRILFVSYRYTAPAMGGAESMVEHLIGALGHHGSFSVDIVAPEVSQIANRWRFHEEYGFDANAGAFINIPNLRFARFPVTNQGRSNIAQHLENAWRAQTIFEKVLSQKLESTYEDSGITWGWGYPESTAPWSNRWAMAHCGIHMADLGLGSLEGYTFSQAFITVRDQRGQVLVTATANGDFKLNFEVKELGAIEIVTSIKQAADGDDPRPLGFYARKLHLAGQAINLSESTIVERALQIYEARGIFEVQHDAAEKTRSPLNVRLTDGRGPWSDELEKYIANNAAKYDLVITHNNVFRPAVVAIEEAKRNGVPVILIPHAHLDDDYYHFPDLLESARNADLVLAAPKIACDFFAARGCNVRYLPAGVDTAEQFTAEDIDAFRGVWLQAKPFVLVLGRKAGAKGYRKVISAVESINSAGTDLHVILIGPDDDGLPVDSLVATYLGRQPRAVVRGALQTCVALVNMSTSESFGIVLLEAWLAGKPVIVNKGCAAFHDMAVDGETALMVDGESLTEAISSVINDPIMSNRLAAKGREVALQYDWELISKSFLDICIDAAR